MVYVRDSYLASWASATWIAPIDDFADVEEQKKDLPKGAINQMSFAGKLHGLPYYAGRTVMAYNNEHLEQGGFSVPPATWDELRKQSMTLKEEGISEYPLLLQLNKSEHIMETIEILSFGRGGRLFDDNNKPLFLQDNTLGDTLLWIKSGIAEGWIDPASLNSTDHEVVRALSAGGRTFSFLSDYNLKTLNDPESSSTAGKMKMSLVPGNEKTKSGSTALIRFYAITSGSDQKDAAWKLLKFLGGRNKAGEFYVAKKWAANFDLGFVQKPLFEDEEIKASFAGWGDPTVLQEQDEYVVPRFYRFTPWFQEWQNLGWGKFQKVILGTASTSDVLADLNEQVLSLAKENE